MPLMSIPVCTYSISLMCFWTFIYPVLVTKETKWESVWVRDMSIIPTRKAGSHKVLLAGDSKVSFTSSQGTASSFICWGSTTSLWDYLGHVSVSNDRTTYLLPLEAVCSGLPGTELRVKSWLSIFTCYRVARFNRSFIFLCSELAADNDENKLWPTFWELPLSSLSPGNQGVPQWGRIENWNTWPGRTQKHGDKKHHI